MHSRSARKITGSVGSHFILAVTPVLIFVGCISVCEMFFTLVLNPPTKNQLELIHKDLGIDQDKIENNLELLKKWLDCESYLPKNIDDLLLKNFLRGCKGNLEKTKQKIEKFLTAKTKLNQLFVQKSINEIDFILYEIQKSVFVSTNYTEKGYRVIMYRLPTQDATHFDQMKISKYIFLILEFLLYNDISSGYEFIYDPSNVTAQTITKFNLMALKHAFDLFYNILPIRTRSIFVINSNKFFEIVLGVAKSVMPKKIKERINYGTVQDLMKAFPSNCIPIEYGGTDQSVNERSDQYVRLFEDQSWIEKIINVKLTGQLPEHKKKLYSFDDFDMGGSFRKLNID